jgi:DNA-binding FrmR family transcriptional regulator
MKRRFTEEQIIGILREQEDRCREVLNQIVAFAAAAVCRQRVRI